MRIYSFCLFFSSWITFDLGWVYSVSIYGLLVPESIKNGSDSVILDCLYTLHSKEMNLDSGLVVKWFFNRSPYPVYQWIHTQKPQDAGILKGRLKLDYKASNNTSTMYRALYISKPTVELSGEYKCLVSTYHGEDFMMKKMIIYVPEKRIDFFYWKQDEDKINVTCRVEGLYPEPKISLFKYPDRRKNLPIEEVTMYISRSRKNGGYDVIMSAIFLEEELESPTAFDCEMKIPGTHYTKRKTLLYLPGTVQSLSSVRNMVTHPVKISFVLLIISTLVSCRFRI